MDPSGKVCIVTGSAQGLGKEVSGHLLQQGAKVCILDVFPEYGQKTADEFQSQYGKGNVMFIQCDVTNKDNLEGAFDKVVSEFGGLDILFNNAGVALPKEIVLKINLYPFGILPEYHASKMGLVGYTRSRALECGKKYGVNFRIIAPTAMETKLMESFLQTCSVPAEEAEATCPAEDRPLVGLDQAARVVMMCIAKNDLPQGALIKVVKDGNFLVYPEKIPSEKLLDA